MELTIESFKISDNGKSKNKLGFHYDLSPSGYGTWKNVYFDPVIYSDHFEFGIKYHSGGGYWSVGIADESTGKKFPLTGRNCGYGKDGPGSTKASWGLGGGSGRCFHNGVDIRGVLVRRPVGKILMFTVNKKEKKFSVTIEGTYYDMFTDMNFPKGIRIVIGCAYCHEHFELVHFNDLSPQIFGLFGCSEKVRRMMKEEETLRFNFVAENGDFPIQLKNKTLKLWKPLFALSNIIRKNQTSSSLQQPINLPLFKYESLNVNEKTILSLIISKKESRSSSSSSSSSSSIKEKEDHNIIRDEDLMDYFIFFKTLGMKQQMISILSRISKMGFLDLYSIFRSFVRKYENESVKSWFTLDPDFEESISFDQSFSLVVFNQMKDKSSEIKRGSELFKKVMKLPGSNVVLYHLENFTIQNVFGNSTTTTTTNSSSSNQQHHRREIVRSSTHPDFIGMDLENVSLEEDNNNNNSNSNSNNSNKYYMENMASRQQHKHLFEYLWKEKFSCNITLTTRDGGRFECHKEVLISSYNFFFRMIRFGGSESESLKNTGTIELENLGKDATLNLLSFCYTGELVVGENYDVKNLIMLLFHAEKYQEAPLMAKVLEILKSLIPNSETIEIRKVVSDIGYLLLMNENVSKFIIPLICQKISEIEVMKLMRKSEKKRKVFQVMKGLEDRIDAQQKTIDLQKKRIDLLTDIVKKHFPEDFEE